MKTASLGRRLGDWLGIVPEDDTATTPRPPAVTPEFVKFLPEPEPAVAPEPEVVPAPEARLPEPELVVPEPPRAPEPLGRPSPEPVGNVQTFRRVVNERRAWAQGRDHAGGGASGWNRTGR